MVQRFPLLLYEKILQETVPPNFRLKRHRESKSFVLKQLHNHDLVAPTYYSNEGQFKDLLEWIWWFLCTENTDASCIADYRLISRFPRIKT
jgi:hypothetical protein